MKITRAGQTPSDAGPADWFAGNVRIDPPFAAEPPCRAVGAHVTVEPGARTAWHTQPSTVLIGSPHLRRSSWLSTRLR
ncbi:hypothetical protein SAMN04487972_1437 [Paracoccus halophilus]|uniref:Cupin n=1 Tax=Paracoccus halophilus TaxID=376733 RepID=A0A1I0UDA6_9RHOB|nr:hypothetical protein [Paracoccus halophilus]SFA62011.1 hypothetical protein SAMN04487972_1437 [Paracoccus halophilus]